MTKGPFTEHSGKRFTFTPATKIYRLDGKLTSVKWRGLEAGVWIETLDGPEKGKKIWRPNSDFEHITGLKFDDPTIRLFKP